MAVPGFPTHVLGQNDFIYQQRGIHMEAIRRRHLTDPNEPLTINTDALATVDRVSKWREETNLPDERIITGTLCVVPLPLYVAVPEGARQFPEVKPEALWHPLFWLPPRLARRYNMPDGKGGYAPETDQLWGLRIALEMVASGLYTPEGGWVDLMAQVGLDTTNDVDLARLEEWQAGAPDELLDSIDLEPLMYKGDGPDAVLTSSVGMLEPLTEQQWAMVSNNLLMTLWDAADDPQVSFEQLVDTTILVATLALSSLIDVPTDEDEEGTVDFWERILTRARGAWPSREAFIAGPFKEAEDWLSLTRDTYWDASKELTEMVMQGAQA